MTLRRCCRRTATESSIRCKAPRSKSTCSAVPTARFNATSTPRSAPASSAMCLISPRRPRLRSRVDSVLAAARPARRAQPVRDRWQWLGGGALAGCMATVLAWFIGTTVLEWREGTDIVNEAVADHVRATLSNHLTDVATSDRHTVKPWLSARLDYSPPVQDLASEGLRADRRTPGLSRPSPHCHAGLPLSRARHRCVRAAGIREHGRAIVAGAGQHRARIQRRAYQRVRHGLGGGVRCERGCSERVCCAARAWGRGAVIDRGRLA